MWPPDLYGSCAPQNGIATHESNGIDIIIALILNDINPLGKYRMDLVLELKVPNAIFSQVLSYAWHLIRYLVSQEFIWQHHGT